jgi:hypothetical protein
MSITSIPSALILDPQLETPTWNRLPDLEKELFILHEVYSYMELLERDS